MIKRNKQRNIKQMVKTGFAWYRPEQWERLRQVSSDVEKLEEKYEEWLNSASKSLRQLEQAGLSIRKIDVDVEELLKWCQDRGLAVDAGSRARFVLEKVQKTIPG